MNQLPRLGWHSRGYLPHFDGGQLAQFITFRLYDSLPREIVVRWKENLKLEQSSEAKSVMRRKIEAYLDKGYGECHLRDPRIADLMQENLWHHDGVKYRLLAWVLMPNHVHLVVDVRDTPLSRLVKHWKSGAARKANLVLGRRGAFWQEDYFDTRIRDGPHLAQAIRRPPCDPYPWDGAGNVQPFQGMGVNVVEGVY